MVDPGDVIWWLFMTDCGCWGLVMSDSGCFWLFVCVFGGVFWVLRFSWCYGVYLGIFSSARGAL